MLKIKIYLRAVVIAVICLIVIVIFSNCNKDDEASSFSYPYTEYEFLYLGNKSGLTSSSSDQAFSNGLNEVLQTWSENNPSTGELVFDGVTYELINIQDATGAILNYIWDIFWDKLDEYSYSIGSCWALSEVELPSKGGIGTAYMLYTIVTNTSDSEVLYVAVKANISPKSSSKTKSAEINQLINAEKLIELSKLTKAMRH